MTRIKQESNFARSIMNVVVSDDVSKAHVAKAAEKLKAVVITPILDKLTKHERLLDYETQVLHYLASEHSSDGVQWGGAMPSESKVAISANIELQKELLTTLSERMGTDKIMRIADAAELAGVIKATTDCSYAYVELLPETMHGSNFTTIKNMIAPTPEELVIRVKRTEAGQAEHRAISFGIGTEVGKDIAPAQDIPSSTERVHKAGQASFAGADVFQRARIIEKQYDSQVKRVDALRASHEHVSGDELSEAEQTLGKIAEKMDYYRIPKEPQSRPPDFQTLDIPQPSIQKLARLGREDGEEPLPLVASASGTTARALIALHDMELFNTDGTNFDRESAQYLSAILCGTIVHGGHHSVLEVGEMYNRLLDCQAIDDLDNKQITRDESTMGYYEIGDSVTLVPEAMRASVLVNYNIKNQADFKREFQNSSKPDPGSPTPPAQDAAPPPMMPEVKP